MIKASIIVQHFDLVNFILLNHRRKMITEIAQSFNQPLDVVQEVYKELEIDPLEVSIEAYIDNGKGEEFIGHQEITSDTNWNPKNEEADKKVKRYIVVKPSKRESDRQPFVRPPAEYSNGSPYNIAKDLHEGKDITDAES